MTETATTAQPSPRPATPPPVAKVDPRSRRTLRALGRKKRQLKLKTDSAFAKAFFESKSKRSTEKKSGFRKKKKSKK